MVSEGGDGDDVPSSYSSSLTIPRIGSGIITTMNRRDESNQMLRFDS